MSMHTFEFHHYDFGDDADSVWVAAWVDGDRAKGIGAYIDREGDVTLNDHIAWCIDNDLAAMGIDPESDEARALLGEWMVAAKKRGLRLLEGVS